MQPRTFNNILFILLLSTALLMDGCKKDDPAPSEQEIVMGKLTAQAWRMGTVTVDGVDKTSAFTNLTLTFTTTAFTATNGNYVWPSGGTWSFVGNDLTKVKRNDGVEVNIVEVTDSTLKLSLTWEGTIGPGRVASIGGSYVFSLVK